MKKSEVKVKQTSLETHPQYALEYWQIKAFFEGDETIQISEIDNKTKSCTITVNDLFKEVALEALIKTKDLKVNIILEGDGISENMMDYLLKDNPHYDHLEVFKDEESGIEMMKALMFKAEVMHYFSDDMFSPTSHTAILPYQLARELFYENLNYQTELK